MYNGVWALALLVCIMGCVLKRVYNRVQALVLLAFVCMLISGSGAGLVLGLVKGVISMLWR